MALFVSTSVLEVSLIRTPPIISPKRSVRLAQPLCGMFFTHTLAAYFFDGNYCSNKKKNTDNPQESVVGVA